MYKKTKIYFVSDAHLGSASDKSSDERETLIVEWLNEIKEDASEIYLLGDIFDFWFEYKYVVPKGFVRILSKLRELHEQGITIYYFKGNHDMWTFDYISEITGAVIKSDYEIKTVCGKKLFIGHGYGLGKCNKKDKILKWFFSRSLFQFLFKILPPFISFSIATSWSKASRKKHDYTKTIDYNEEVLVKYAKTILEKEDIDFFIFGHRHIPFQIKLNENTVFTNVGDWLINYTYAVFDGEKIKIIKKYFK